jgi:hypothetical protein
MCAHANQINARWTNKKLKINIQKRFTKLRPELWFGIEGMEDTERQCKTSQQTRQRLRVRGGGGATNERE